MKTMTSSAALNGQTVQQPDLAFGPGAAARAFAAVDWTPTPSTRRCECGQRCKHGSRCPDCGMRRQHIARRPAVAGQRTLTKWVETYLCDTCGTLVQATVDRPNLPWGAQLGPHMVQVFDGIATGQFDDDDTIADTDLGYEPKPDTVVQIPPPPRQMPQLPATIWGLP